MIILLLFSCSNVNDRVEKLKLELEKLKWEFEKLKLELGPGKFHTPGVDVPKSGGNQPNNLNGAKITGNSVYLRSDHSIQSKGLAILTKGQTVEILKEHRPEGNENEAILRTTAYFYDSYTNEMLFTLVKGKAVVIEDFDGNQYSISYQDDKSGKKGYAQLSPSQVELISGEIWYYVSTNSGLRGWVIGKYVNKN